VGRRILTHLLGLALGMAPGVAYAAGGVVGPSGAAFLIGLGGAVGLALTWPSVSARRVIHALAKVTPLAWPVAVFVSEDDPPPPAVPDPYVPGAEPGWLTSDVVGMAQAIREAGAADLMPILADALEDAGCADAELLRQCRAGECRDRIVEWLLAPAPEAEPGLHLTRRHDSFLGVRSHLMPPGR
jgi:hypothetical protein